MKFRPIFEVNTITGLRYVELQRLHDNADGITYKKTDYTSKESTREGQAKARETYH